MSNFVRFYYDIVSPWSYVSFHVIRKYRAAWDMRVDWKPISLAYVMKHSGNRPPMMVPNKGRMQAQEVALAKKMFDVPMIQPPTFPFDTMQTQAFLRSVQDQRPEILESLTEALYAYAWGNGKSFSSAEDIRTLARPFFGDESLLDKLIEECQTKEARQRLGSEAKTLVENEGCFGTPWIIATRALDDKSLSLFGSDRFEHLAAFLHKPYLGTLATGTTAQL